MNAIASLLGAKRAEDSIPLLVCHLNIFVYACSFWLCQPVFPFLVTELGASMITYGYLQTAFSFAQMIGSLVFGRIADSYGARFSLHASQFGGALSYLLLSISSSVPLLFISRVPTTLQHCMMAAQAAVTTYTSSETRRKAIGLLSLSYAGGMVVGSAVGGTLSAATSYKFVAATAGALSLAIIPVTHVLLPHVRQSPRVSASDPEHDKETGLGAAFSTVWQNPALLQQLSFIVAVGSAFSLQRSSFSMMAKSVFGLNAANLGYLMSFGGILSMVTNVTLGAFPRSWSDKWVLTICSIILCPSFVAYSLFAVDLTSLIFVLAPLSVLSTIIYTVNTSALSKLGGDNAGLVIGLNHSIRSGLGIVTPTIAGFMVAYSASSIGISGAILIAIGVFIVSFAK